MAKSDVDETLLKMKEREAKRPATVRIKIPRDRNNKDDVYVSVNGERFQIKRGVDVEVPYSVAMVLEWQEKQDLAAQVAREQMQERAKSM